MKSQFWSNLSAAIINAICTGSFSQFKQWFQQLFDAVTMDRQDPPIIVVGNKRDDAYMVFGEAPDAIKDALRDVIKRLVERAFSGRPVLLKLVTAFLDGAVLDKLIDSVWDSIFAAKIAAGEIRPSSEFVERPLVPVMESPNPLVCSADDLRECCAEMGDLSGLGLNAGSVLADGSRIKPMSETTLTPAQAGAQKPSSTEPLADDHQGRAKQGAPLPHSSAKESHKGHSKKDH